MIVADRISEYTVLDAGEGMKLENWGGRSAWPWIRRGMVWQY